MSFDYALCVVGLFCKNKKANERIREEDKKAKENITEGDKRLLDWEKVNALQYVRKDSLAQQEKLDSRVVVIENRCVWMFNLVQFIGITGSHGKKLHEQ